MFTLTAARVYLVQVDGPSSGLRPGLKRSSVSATSAAGCCKGSEWLALLLIEIGSSAGCEGPSIRKQRLSAAVIARFFCRKLGDSLTSAPLWDE